MNTSIQSLLDELQEFEASAPGVGFQLRLSLSEILLKHLRLKGWTQSKLAEQAGMKEPQISRIIHSDVNCTLDTIGKLFFALGVRVQFQEESAAVWETDAVGGTIRLVGQESTYGQEDFTQEGSTQESWKTQLAQA